MNASGGPDDRTAQSWDLRRVWPSHQSHRHAFDLGDGAGVGTCLFWARTQSESYFTLSLLMNSNNI